jgi:hypothetical protein
MSSVGKALRLRLDLLERDGTSSPEACRFLALSQVPCDLLGKYAPDALADKLEMPRVSTLDEDECECVYWNVVLRGYPRGVMKKVVQGLGVSSPFPILLPKPVKLAEEMQNIWGGRMHLLGEKYLLAAGQWASNFPREDAHLAFAVPKLDAVCVAVIDGHGSSQVAEIVHCFLPILMLRRSEFSASFECANMMAKLGADPVGTRPENVAAAVLAGVVLELEAMILTWSRSSKRLSLSGCCLTVALVLEEFIMTANVGDCRACVVVKDGRGMRAERLTVDHTPRNAEEAVRVKRACAPSDLVPLRPSW